MWRTTRALRGLCFDVENKPGTYGPGDYTHPKMTALACQFLDEPPARGWILRRAEEAQMRSAAEEFLELWRQADFVMGHNIRRHDVKILNGWLWTLGLPPLPKKRLVDTYLDVQKTAGLSRSLENLAARWNCPIRKLHLSEGEWERAYDGVPSAESTMLTRVLSDVQISIWLHGELIRRGLLKVNP